MSETNTPRRKRVVVTRSRIAITKRTLDALEKPDKDTVLWDRQTRRFGVRLTPSGVVSFLIQYRNPQGRSRRLTIGTYGTWTPAAARDEAERLLRLADSGGDPVQARQEERKAITFKQLAEEYMDKTERGLILVRRGKEYKPKKPGTVVIDRYRMEHLKRHFGDKAVKNITSADCRNCLEKLIAGKHGAARTFGFLGGVLTYAVKQQYITQNPAHGIEKPGDGRRRFRLDEAGYRSLGKALERAESRAEPWQAIAAIRLIALSGCRKSEIRALKLIEIDYAGRCLRLGDPKSGQVRPLGEPALRLLKAIARRPGRPKSEYLLPGPRDPRKAFNGFGGATEGAWKRIVGNSYTAHGLRHAFGSIAGDLGFSELTIGALLGHAKGSVTAGYVHLDKLLLAAADQVSRWIWEAMTGEPLSAEVLELPRAAGAA